MGRDSKHAADGRHVERADIQRNGDTWALGIPAELLTPDVVFRWDIVAPRERPVTITGSDECLDSGKFAATWQQNRTEGQGYGVSATPTFFINGRMITGARPLEAFTEIIDEELARVTKVAAR